MPRSICSPSPALRSTRSLTPPSTPSRGFAALAGYSCESAPRDPRNGYRVLYACTYVNEKICFVDRRHPPWWSWWPSKFIRTKLGPLWKKHPIPDSWEAAPSTKTTPRGGAVEASLPAYLRSSPWDWWLQVHSSLKIGDKNLGGIRVAPFLKNNCDSFSEWNTARKVLVSLWE